MQPVVTVELLMDDANDLTATLAHILINDGTKLTTDEVDLVQRLYFNIQDAREASL